MKCDVVVVLLERKQMSAYVQLSLEIIWPSKINNILWPQVRLKIFPVNINKNISTLIALLTGGVFDFHSEHKDKYFNQMITFGGNLSWVALCV